MAKIDIISGFLGAGKTTLIKKLIKETFKDEKVVLIENEFGEIGIDGGFLKEAGIQVNELNSGCICCSLVGDFGKALKQVVEQYSPDRIIIEPSGVGKLSDVIKAVQNAAKYVDLTLNSATTVADVSKTKMYIKNFGEFFLNQIEAAGTIVLSRTQNVDEAKLLEVVNMIKEKNSEARIITTPWDDISGQVILDAIEHSSKVEDIMNNFKLEEHHHDDEDEEEHEHHHHHHHHDEDECDDPECECHHHHDEDECDDPECECHHHHHHEDEEEHEHHHHHHHHADEVFTSWGKETAAKYDEDELKTILDKLSQIDDNPYGIILRAKGIVPDKANKWHEFDLVPGEYEVREGAADYTGKLCVIGSKLDEEKIAELFGLN